MSDAWHKGERELHQRLGLDERMQDRSRLLRSYMPDQHRLFFASLSFIVLSAVDKNGMPWPFIRIGEPGFVKSDDPKQLSITSPPLSTEPNGLRLLPGDKISLLGIQFETGRRNRMNGTITENSEETLKISVDQSFGNCAKYIHARNARRFEATQDIVNYSADLTPLAIRQIATADTIFIASRNQVLGGPRSFGVDVNHRGGKPGFVKLEDTGELVFPDYEGNNFFNTMGNLLVDPRVSIMFPDFTNGDVLTVAGHGEVIMDPGTRAVKIKPETVQYARQSLPMRYVLEALSADTPEP